MICLLTSFQRSHLVASAGLPVFSAAVYPPRGYETMNKAEWADIRRDGKWTRPRDFIEEDEPLVAYHQALLNLYTSRKDQIADWLQRVSPFWSGAFALCCWCPYDRAAQRQLEEHGSFVCHTAVIGEVLEIQHGVQAFYDDDRRRMKVLP